LTLLWGVAVFMVYVLILTIRGRRLVHQDMNA